MELSSKSSSKERNSHERVKIKTVKTSKGAVSVTVGVPKGFARADMELRSTGGTTVYKRNNRTTYTRIDRREARNLYSESPPMGQN